MALQSLYVVTDVVIQCLMACQKFQELLEEAVLGIMMA